MPPEAMLPLSQCGEPLWLGFSGAVVRHGVQGPSDVVVIICVILPPTMLFGPKRAYEAFQRGDIPAVLQMVTDDVDWELHGPPDIPFAGKATGRKDVADFFRKLVETVTVCTFASSSMSLTSWKCDVHMILRRPRVKCTLRDG